MICKECGKEFEPKDVRERYCSNKCRKLHWAKYLYEYNRKDGGCKLVSRECPICGTHFEGRTNKKYCSKRCAHAASWKAYIERMHN